MHIKTTQVFYFLLIFFLFFNLTLFTFFPSTSYAAEMSSDQHVLKPVNFSDYYHYGSVVAEINTQTSKVSAGTPLAFKIDVKNNNEYPIADGRIYIKIFRQQAATTANGSYVVEATLLPNVLTLKAGETVSLPYVWQTPTNAVSGNYRISTYVIAGKDTNLSGHPFKDDVAGSTYDFSIRGTNETVQFDKNNVFLNGYKYYFATFPLIVDSKIPIVIKAPITNTTKNVAVVKVTWKTYNWSQIDTNGTGLIDTIEANYTVLPNQKNEISYTVNDTNKSVYYVEGTLTNGETKSIIGLRFARVSNDNLHVNFSTTLSYPLKSGVPAFIFTSVHNTAEWPIPNVKTILTVKDNNGNSVYESSYTGDVSGNILGLKDSFTPKKDYTSFSLETRVYDGDKLVETISTKYDCAAFGEPCPQNDYTQILLIVGGVILVLIIGGVIYKKNHNMKFFNTIHSVAPSFMIAFFLFVPSVEAKTVSVYLASTNAKAHNSVNCLSHNMWNTINTVNDCLYDGIPIDTSPFNKATVFGWFNVRGWNFTFMNTFFWGYKVEGAWLRINYNTKVFDSIGTEITDGATVPVGSVIKLRFLPHVREDVSLFTSPDSGSVRGLGYAYGRWDSTTPIKDYNDLDFIVTGRNKAYADSDPNSNPASLYISAPVVPPQKTLNTPSNLSCGNYVTDSYGYGKDCTVTAAGTIQPVFNFAETTGLLLPYSTSTGWYTKDAELTYYTIINGVWTAVGPETRFTVPTQNVTYSLTAAGGNNPPAAPVITGPTSGIVYFSQPTNIASVISALVRATSSTYTYQASSVDPDGDIVRTGWDFGAGQPEAWTSYVASGAQSSNVDRNWTIATTTTFRVIAQDSKGAYSEWTPYTVVITTNCTAPAAPASISPSGTGSAGLQNITWSTVSGVSSYTININDTTSDAAFTPGSNSDVTTNVTTNTYAYTFQSGHSYSLWVNSNAPCGAPSTNNTWAQVVIPSVSVSADLKLNGQDKLTVAVGDAVTLSWTSSNATNCSSNGTTPFMTGGATSGSISFTASASASYGLRCVNATTDANDAANLTVSGVPEYGTVTVSLQSKPSLNAQYRDVSAIAISEKTSVYLQWVPNGAKNVFCSLQTLGGEVANDTNTPSRMYTTPALSESRVYTVTCSNPISTASDSVRIGVLKVSEF